MVVNNQNNGINPQPVVNPAIVSTTGVQNQYNSLSNDLNSFTSSDPYAAIFQRQLAAASASNAATANNAIASATAATARAQNKNSADSAAFQSGLASRGETSGASRYLPEYQAGLMQQAKDQFTQRFQLLDQQEKISIANAMAAKQAGDVKIAQQQFDYARQLRAEKASALEKAQQMEWEKYKFNHLSAAQSASEARLNAAASDGEVKFTPLELKKIEQAGLSGESYKTKLNFIYGENKGIVPLKFKPENIEDFGKGKVWDLALALGVSRNKNLNKQDEIDSLFSNPKFVSYVQDQINEGLTIEDIIDLNT